MVKPDFARDYYGDLGLDSTADAAAIKKQYRILALKLHPDRNPGRESEFNAPFQVITTAHEVLIDPATKRQYDERRTFPSTATQSRYQSGGNQRGNPWSNVGTQFPPPPKAPTARNSRPPPPSAGAQRYSNFEAPKQSANAKAQEGADARRSTYEAWEHMRSNRQAPPSRSDSSKPKQPPPKAARPAYEEFRASHNSPQTSPRRAQSSSASNRKGFVPTTPGGDESPAPKGAYFTARKSQAPPPPPRNVPVPASTSAHENTQIPVDPLRQFRTPDVQFEPRLSTPYATHGGEKFDLNKPGESLDPNSGVNRSKSTYERRNKSQQQMPRADSDSNLNSPQYGQSHAGRTPSNNKSSYSMPTQDTDSSSSDSGPTMAPRTFANARRTRKQQSATQGPTSSAATPSSSQANGTNDQPQSETSNAPGQTNGEPSMYENSHIPSSQQRQKSEKRLSTDGVKLSTVSEHILFHDVYCAPLTPCSSRPIDPLRKPNASALAATAPPSGDPGNLYPVEEATRSVIDDMLKKRNNHDSMHASLPHRAETLPSQPSQNAWHTWREPAQDGSSSTQQQSKIRRLWNLAKTTETNADRVNGESRFSIPVDGNTFKRNGSASSDNINMKFSSEAWAGKFEGSSMFEPEQKAANMSRNNTRSRTQSGSGSRSRGRSPIKPRSVDPHYMQQPSEPETIVESPGGTKFSQEEWAKTFKNPTFVAPPPPSNSSRPTRSRPVRKPVGAATVVDESDSPPETSAAQAASPDAMDIDTPPVMRPTVPRMASNVTNATKCAASPPATTAELNVEFEELRVKDLISSLALPKPPTPPEVPSQCLEMEPYHQYMDKFGQYMTEWDYFDSRMLLHFVTRKNINKATGERRWTDDKAFDSYRMGLRDDRVVMTHLNRAQEGHAKAVKDCAVVREKMREFGESPGKKAA